jgi:tRNA(fMet)-specific endonuclease VapC
VTYLLDTDMCIYWLNGSQSILDHIKATGLTDIAISTITVAELYFDAYNSVKVNENVARVEIFVSHLKLLSLDDSIPIHSVGRKQNYADAVSL